MFRRLSRRESPALEGLRRTISRTRPLRKSASRVPYPRYGRISIGDSRLVRRLIPNLNRSNHPSTAPPAFTTLRFQPGKPSLHPKPRKQSDTPYYAPTFLARLPFAQALVYSKPSSISVIIPSVS